MSLSALSPRCVLQATARSRVVVGYAVDPARVAPLLPEGLAPARYDGSAYVSLVGVELTNVRAFGLVGLGVRRVPAVELRVHVQPAEAPSGPHGTWTAQAHVPRRLVAWGARWLYGTPVAVASMQPMRREQDDRVEVTYRFDWRGREQRIRVQGAPPPTVPAPDARARTLLSPTGDLAPPRTARCSAPASSVQRLPSCRVQEHHVTVRWPAVYGDLGRVLQGRSPSLVLLSPSTPVTLRWRTRA
jgi:Uncharacterized conserved protein